MRKRIRLLSFPSIAAFPKNATEKNGLSPKCMKLSDRKQNISELFPKMICRPVFLLTFPACFTIIISINKYFMEVLLMKVAFFDTKPYDVPGFDHYAAAADLEIKYF